MNTMLHTSIQILYFETPTQEVAHRVLYPPDKLSVIRAVLDEWRILFVFTL